MILWGDEDVRVARLDETDWLVNNYTSGLRIREGELVRGGGGFYPPDAAVAGLADGEVPADCKGPDVQLHDIAKFDPSKPAVSPIRRLRRLPHHRRKIRCCRKLSTSAGTGSGGRDGRSGTSPTRAKRCLPISSKTTKVAKAICVAISACALPWAG